MNNKITKKDINQVFVRNLFGLQLGWNYEKMQGLGYSYVMMPIIKKLYKDNPDDMKKALKLHLGFFNTTPAMSNLIVGANIALEKEVGMENETAIAGLKTGLMGPFAGVGDTLFVAIYRAIVFSVASYIALNGQPVALLIPIIAGSCIILTRYKFTQIGYKQGTKLAGEFAGRMKLFTEGASILGLTVVGGLIPSVIKATIDLNYTMGDVTLSFQEMLDKIMPALVPLGIVLFSYWLLGKKKMNSTRLIFVLIALGMVLGNLSNIFGKISSIF